MEFPKSYFEDEVREGFYVSSLMKRAWAAQLEVLEDIDKVCQKHHIKYFADWGTLLGAIRHGGFIPWDDDMDICMKREDYDKFSKVAPLELQEFYNLNNLEHCGENQECQYYITRVHSGRRIRTDQQYMEKFHGFPYVTGIDIFPLDYLPPTDKEDQLLCKEIKILSTLVDNISNIDEKEMNAHIKKIEQIYNVHLDKKRSLQYQLHALADGIGRRFQAKDAKYITDIPTHTINGYKLPKEYYENSIRVPFENTTIPVPIAYHEILKKQYGDYMIPIKDGGAHKYPFFDEQRVNYEKTCEPLFKTYQFNPEHMKDGEERMQKGNTLKEIVNNMIVLIEKAHQGMVDLLEAGDFEPVLTILEDCQEGAIALGTKIEEVKGEGHATVIVLEKYCEVLYTIHEAILGNIEMDVQTAIDLLNDNLAVIDVSMKKEIINKRVAVFLPYKAAMWDSLESVWKAAEEDPECDAYVVPIPYYDRNMRGQLEELHYEGDEYPDYVKVYDYNTFNLECLHPDKIYIHNPYDEYNMATSVHPYFYSKNIKKYTNNLVYIPYFVLDEIEPTNKRAVMSMEHFVTTAGVMHADTVIVQSEAMRQAYIEALVKFAGEDTRLVWEQKILGLGSPKYDKLSSNLTNVQIPDEWKKVLYKAGGEKRKVVFYNTTLVTLLEHNEKTLDKIEKVLEQFKDNQKEVALLWRPHPLIKETLKSMRPQLYERYERIERKYCEEAWGIYDDTIDLNRAIQISDIYYGDPSSIVQLCRKIGMPVSFQDIKVL
ncbi:MAG: LicD family protein [Lachnospiraceae bacterium]|nr:LicD family protein [Lachnospiraceae bacterium]